MILGEICGVIFFLAKKPTFDQCITIYIKHFWISIINWMFTFLEFVYGLLGIILIILLITLGMLE